MNLSILCVTQARSHALPFIERMLDVSFVCEDTEVVIAADGDFARASLGYLDRFAKVVQIRTEGFFESGLDEALSHCSGKYVLRLDDDEQVSFAMNHWLVAKKYLTSDHWQFMRAWLWKDKSHQILSQPYWPDWQTRLSLKSLSGGRTKIHAGSPYGSGTRAFVAIEHHKLLLTSVENRRMLVEHYESIQPGAGCREFYLPDETIPHLEIGDWK